MTVQLDDKGLVPAIAQNADTGEVIMLGYMSPGALKRTLEGGEVWFYSRSRADLWHKGEVSGNYMRVRSAAIDCDADVILLQVDPDGPDMPHGRARLLLHRAGRDARLRKGRGRAGDFSTSSSRWCRTARGACPRAATRPSCSGAAWTA